MIVALKLPDGNLGEWLSTVAERRVFRYLEVSAVTVETVRDFPRLLEKHDLKLLNVPDLLSRELALYMLRQSSPENNKAAIDNMIRLLTSLVPAGLQYAGLQLALDLLDEDKFEDEFAQRQGLLRELLEALADLPMKLCVWGRYPREFPGCLIWDRSRRLVLEARNPCCRLGVHLVPEELETDFSVSAFVRDIGFQAGVMRFSYFPGQGEELSIEMHRQFAEALKMHGYKGGIVLAPQLQDVALERAAVILQALERVVEAYQ